MFCGVKPLFTWQIRFPSDHTVLIEEGGSSFLVRKTTYRIRRGLAESADDWFVDLPTQHWVVVRQSSSFFRIGRWRIGKLLPNRIEHPETAVQL